MDTLDPNAYNLIIIVIAYLLGSIPFAVVWSKVFGLQDPRRYGSGNPGATNVLRSGNKTAAVLTLLGDAFKGWFAVWLAGVVTNYSASAVALACIAAFLGHLYPVFLKFKGGKGVATALGILLAISPWLGLFTLITWLAVAYTSRMSSLAAIMAAVLVPTYYLLGADSFWTLNPYV